MRITVIVHDGLISIDGSTVTGVDLSSVPNDIHAIQWYGTDGELEIKDSRGRMIENRQIDSFDEFDFIITLWEQAKAQEASAAKAKDEEEALALEKLLASE